MTTTESIRTIRQFRRFGPKPIDGYGKNAKITATVRYDDECGNGHNTFAVTAEIWRPRRNDCEACGCLHDEIAEAFPELAPFIKWHLCSSDGPMHYPGNALYHAGDKDCWGLRKGESRQIHNGRTGLPCWVLESTNDGLPKYVDADERPKSRATLRYVPLLRVGEGKERELDLARSSAIWPEATDEELMADDLGERLMERLPKLLEEFRAVVESLGFTW